MAGLRLIVGLGNPGSEHARTRHNAGFHFVEALAEKAGARWNVDSKLFGETAKVEIAGQTVWLLKPATFMNLSGKSVTAAQRFWKIEPEETLLAHDELDLPPGAARLKFDGGHGGQNGLRDTIRLLGHGKFHRLRVGIGEPSTHAINHVLSRFTADERRILDEVLDAAADAVEEWAGEGVSRAANRWNTWAPTQEARPDSEPAPVTTVEETGGIVRHATGWRKLLGRG